MSGLDLAGLRAAAAHGPASPRWHGNPRQYQLEAQARFAVHYDRAVLPWSYVLTGCEVVMCLDAECMVIRKPKKLLYPADICVYCGEGGYTRDHLIPEPMTGPTVRTMVLTVPACRWCNSSINDLPSWNVAERRRHAQLRLERKHKKLLLSPHKGPEQMIELGPLLRSVAEKNNTLRERVKARLGWPLSPSYDLRAFQRSGIEDPESLGLCDTFATPLRPEYREAS